jgi:Peptidase family M1 domain
MHSAMSTARAAPAVALALAVAGLAACGGPGGVPRTRPLPSPDHRPALRDHTAHTPRLASYRLSAKLDTANHRIKGSMVLTWTNGGDSEVRELPFHLYLNAFKNESSVFMKESHGEMRGARATDTGWGWIDVTRVVVGQDDLTGKTSFPGPDQTVMDVPLPAPMAPGASTTVTMEFTEQLPEVFARTGYKGAFHMIGQWFPKIGVRAGPPGAEHWECPPFHANAEFFADFGVYDVDVTVPDSEVVAATGVLVGAKDNGDHTRTLTYHAEDVHDFAWMADPYMEVMSGTAKVDGDSVEVRVYYRPDQQDFARRHLAAGIGAIEQFSELYKPYPWPIMSIIDPPPDAASGAGGMEYPTLVTTAGDHALARPGIRIPEFVTVHEVGHNWFQGMVASNEPEEAWLDEGVNEYTDSIVMARLYGERGSLIDWMGWTAETTRAFDASDSPFSTIPSPIAAASWAFADSSAYGEATYAKTASALRTLEGVVGAEAMAKAMRHYVDTWAWKHPTGRDFFASLSESLGQDLSWFVRPAFYGIGSTELSVRRAGCVPEHEPRGVFGEGTHRKTVTEATAPDGGAWVCDVVVVDTGTVPVPVDVEMRFADGTIQPGRWDHRDDGHWHRFHFKRSSRLTEVSIDPEDLDLLDDDPVDDHIRLDGDPAAAARAGARAGFWTQSAMQVFGL